jgi:hypothetical protein
VRQVGCSALAVSKKALLELPEWAAPQAR